MVLCADAGKDGIVGFISASLDAREQLEALSKRRFNLLLAALPSLIRHPNLFGEVSSREKSLRSTDLGGGFITGSGARLAYWGWSPNYPSKGQSMRLLQSALKILRDLGVGVIRLEIDRTNRKVEMAHRLLGARVVKEFKMKDGRVRIVMEHLLNPREQQKFRHSGVIGSQEGSVFQQAAIQRIEDKPNDSYTASIRKDAALNR